MAIKAVAVDDENTQHLIIGLNRENVERLLKRRRLHVSAQHRSPTIRFHSSRRASANSVGFHPEQCPPMVRKRTLRRAVIVSLTESLISSVGILV